MLESAERPGPTTPVRGRGRRRLRLAGELMITVGVVLLLLVVYELGVTNWFTAGAQARASAALSAAWSGGAAPPLAPGQPVSRLSIPAFGPDWVRTVLEGTDAAALAAGPGHYPGTATPGEVGNVAIAGHRVGRGAPFDPLDRLRSCDALVLETRTQWMVYRVLPMAEERAGWAAEAAGRPECRGVAPLPAPYDATPGREIVAPTATDVAAPVPHRPGLAVPPRRAAALLTLTTCEPRFSARERLVVHAVLVERLPKPDDPQARPPVLGAG